MSEKNYLRRLYEGHEMRIPATNGRETIYASDVFTGNRDPSLIQWGLGLPGLPTPEVNIKMYELVKDGQFAKVLESIEGGWQPFSEESQIVAFCRDYPTKLNWRRGWDTFFPLKGEFVVHAITKGKIECKIHEISYKGIWSSLFKPRFVVL
jgi:hypothetical protein